ncbi:MAG: flavin reductase family protein [Chloroflexi bacterium]|jgi:flavin reductase (DIM6/NTAB) family NADH-FMN oxidoreductase RutF|nr:flavin reductase family protein [Chloroflexota bacterium]
MQRERVPYDHKLNKTLELLQKPGLLLAASKKSGESNVMTIGWATVGFIWGKPIFMALVRPSRYTFEFIEDSQCFTVNVPADDLRRWVGICGSRSGREIDKFGEYNIATTPAQTVAAPTIDACPMVYECQVVHYNDLIPANLTPEIDASAYGGTDYHRLYFGHILGAFADPSY